MLVEFESWFKLYHRVSLWIAKRTFIAHTYLETSDILVTDKRSMNSWARTAGSWLG